MSRQSKIVLADKDDCTGCSVCAQSCAKGAISMSEDREGFLQPHINPELCVGCHKCEQVCPIISPINIPQNFETKAYAAINIDEEIRMQSSSGGVFYAIAKWIIEQGGVVFGARWDDKWEVMHDFAEDLEGLKAFMRSKYVQSRVENTYKQAKKFLEDGRWVLYSGTPCQIAGLHSYLGREYEKLVIVDLICHGVPSPGVWRKYLKEKVQGDTIIDISFRDKQDGWKDCQCLTTTTTTTTREKQMDNLYFRGFLNNVFLRRSCYRCQFKTVHRVSDITLADYWGIHLYCPEMDDNKGTSLVFVHTNLGQSVLQFVSNSITLKRQTIIDAIAWNPAINTSSMLTTRRHDFFLGFKMLPFHSLTWLIDKDRLSTRIVRKIKKLMRHEKR